MLFQVLYLYILVYIYGCFLKWWYPPNTPKWSSLVGKPMVVGYHHFRNPLVVWWCLMIHFEFLAISNVGNDFASPKKPPSVGNIGGQQLSCNVVARDVVSLLPGCLWVNGALFEAENSRGNPISEETVSWMLKNFRSQFVRKCDFWCCRKFACAVKFKLSLFHWWWASRMVLLWQWSAWSGGWNFKIVRFLLFREHSMRSFHDFSWSRKGMV